MFYPYSYSETRIMGGIQNVESEWKKGIVNIICEASLGAQLNLKIEDNKLIMVELLLEILELSFFLL
jgi:hypothetical protein